MSTRQSAAVCLAGMVACGFVLGACTTSHIRTEQVSPAATSGFAYDAAAFQDAKPWTEKPFRNHRDNFQFIIIGDRTGGANIEHTFKLAMGQINLLQPEFVINVGDIIDGYTDSRAELQAMWDEADGLTQSLEMPFFYTRGNHDVSNAMAKEFWVEKFGAGHYYFVYQDVLFMILDSEDNPRPEPSAEVMEKMKLYKRLQTENPDEAQRLLADFMSDEAVVAALGQPVEFSPSQVGWIKRTLAEHPNVRWTFLFMHEPCWENPSVSFEQIQELLEGRGHTFFAGHLHYSDYDEVDGNEYITVGPAGASWHHDGPGNVDHLMWVTMTENGPQMANIALKGIFDRKGLDPSLFGAYDRKGAASQ